MGGNRLGQTIADRVERGLASLGALSYRRPIATLSLVAVTCAVALGYASRLQVNADLSELLPKSFPSVAAYETLKARFGGMGFVVVVGRNAEPETLRRFARDVAERVSPLPTVRYVDYLRPGEFFREHALYYLDAKDLETVRHRLEARVAWERRKANPLHLDLDLDLDEPPPPPPTLELSELTHKYAGRSDRRWVSAQLGERYYLDAEERVIGVFVKPAQGSTDLAFSKQLVAQVKEAVQSLDLAAYPGLEVDYAGTYVKHLVQQEVINRDLKVASLLAFVLILGYFLLHFRQVTAMVVGLTPMVVGTLWTYGFSGGAFGVLNILTSFIGAIIMGIGNDHGIHLLGRFKAETAAGRSTAEAIRTTLGNTGRAALISALTTSVGFGGLSLSQFRAFREFGVIAAVGGLLMVLAYIVVLPACLSLAMRTGWRLRPQEAEAMTPLAGFIKTRAGRLLLVAAPAVILGAFLVPQVRFNYDFNSLSDSNLPAFRLDAEVNRLLGYSQTPTVVLTNSLDEERHASEALRAAQAKLGERSTVDFVVSSEDLVPEDQAAKESLLAALGKTLRKVPPRWLTPERRTQRDTLLRMTAVKPFTRDDLPVEVRRQLEGVNATAGEGFVLVFPSISTGDGHALVRYADEVRAIRSMEGEPYATAGEALILADIIKMVTSEAPVVLSLTVLLTFIVALIFIGQLRQTLYALGPTAATLAVSLGLLPLMHLQLNYLNIILIPFLFGYGIESGAHLTTRFAAEPDLERVLPSTGRSIVASLATTAFGFGALLVARHPGLRSLAELALVGLCVNLLATTVVLPAYFAWYHRRRGRSDAAVSR